jgi:hypothetical protein
MQNQTSFVTLLPNPTRIIATRTPGASGVPTIEVRCESSYRSDVAFSVNILKKGQKHSNINVQRLPMDRPIPFTKLKDIHNLLKVAYGAGWKDLPGVEIYLSLLGSPTAKDDVQPMKDCDCAEEDIAFRI